MFSHHLTSAVMFLKIGYLFFTLIVGIFAEDDLSIFFDHTNTKYHRMGRLIGGQIADSAPYMMALTIGADVQLLICGASLATTRYVLTAAHCVDYVVSKGKTIDSLRGRVDSLRYASGGTTYSFSDAIKHPNDTRAIMKNDIAFLVTSSDIVLTDTVSLVSLTFKYIDAGVQATVLGWGLNTKSNTMSEDLLKLEPDVVDGEDCVKRMNDMAKLLHGKVLPVDPTLEICAYSTATTGTCGGDSGSPLMEKGTNEQIGIVSWGIPCALNLPDMYTRVSAFSDWISEHISKIPE